MIDHRLGTIPADFYSRGDVFQRELDAVFQPSWLCVGLAHNLREHNDFITYHIGQRQIVVQNFHGELKAFKNVCSHRFSRIQCEQRGNRPLQ